MPDPIIAIVGNLKTHEDAPAAAEALGRELARAGFRILVYSSGESFLEGRIVKGYAASQKANRRSIQVRYPLHLHEKPSFPEQKSQADLFDWRPDDGEDWEMSFYQSLKEVDGIVLMGGGPSTLIAGVVALGYGTAVLAMANFGGAAANVWERLRPGRDLPNELEKALMACPWSEDQTSNCVQAIKDQLARKAAVMRQRLIEERRKQTSLSKHAFFALIVFVLAVAAVPTAFTWHTIPEPVLNMLLFFSPLLAGVAGSTIRLVFDASQGGGPLTAESSITTAALGLIAGGVAGLLFITAQITTAPSTAAGVVVSADQARKLVLFGVLIGFVAGLTMDAVFRKLISSDVVDVSSIEVKKRP